MATGFQGQKPRLSGFFRVYRGFMGCFMEFRVYRVLGLRTLFFNSG